MKWGRRDRKNRKRVLEVTTVLFIDE